MLLIVWLALPCAVFPYPIQTSSCCWEHIFHHRYNHLLALSTPGQDQLYLLTFGTNQGGDKYICFSGYLRFLRRYYMHLDDKFLTDYSSMPQLCASSCLYHNTAFACMHMAFTLSRNCSCHSSCALLVITGNLSLATTPVKHV